MSLILHFHLLLKLTKNQIKWAHLQQFNATQLEKKNSKEILLK